MSKTFMLFGTTSGENKKKVSQDKEFTKKSAVNEASLPRPANQGAPAIPQQNIICHRNPLVMPHLRP
jgi:hypothetical protein